MKNLTLRECRSARLCSPSGGTAQFTDFCASAAEGRLFAATSDGQLLCFKQLKVEWHVELFPPGCEGLHVTSMSYSLELEAVVLSLSSGALLLVHAETREAEEVGSVEGGIMAMEWSPDGDVLALITGTGNLLVMNQDWEALSETLLLAQQQQQPDEAQLADARVTWRGDGKFFATSVRSGASRSIKVWDRSTFELHSVAEPAERLAAPLSWQPNGRHVFAAQHASAAPGARHRVLLYERNGLGHGGFDLPLGSGTVRGLSWSLDSELLAVLLGPETESQVAGTAEGSGGWTLQVWHRSNWHWYLKQERRYAAATTSAHSPASAPADHPPLLVKWDDQQPAMLHVLRGSDGLYEALSLQWEQCVSDRGTALVVDGAALLLTPLRHVKVPPPMCAARCCLPEPAVAVALSSSQLGPQEQVAAVMADGRLALLRSVEEDLWEETLEEQDTGDAEALSPWVPDLGRADGLAAGRCIRAVCWLDACTLLLLASRRADGVGEAAASSGDVLLEVQVAWGEDGGGTVRVGTALTYTGSPVLGIVGYCPGGDGGALVQGEAGQLWQYVRCGTAAPGRLVSLGPHAALPAPCPWLAAVPPLTPSSAPRAPAVGLSAAGQLYWGAELVASEVTSFALRSGGAGGPALLYTTRKSLLYTVFFAQLLPSGGGAVGGAGGYRHRELLAIDQDQASVDQQQQQQRHKQQHQLGSAGIHIRQESESRRDDDMRAAMHAAMRPSALTAAARDVVVRAVEQGSRLVAAPKDDVVAVLQMPRGNLESVSPRALVLAAITHALAEQRFAEAWRLASVNRVDLNLLVDFQWPSILPLLPSFVAAVPRPADLCDLLFALRPDSVVAPGGIYWNTPAVMQQRQQQPASESSEAGVAQGKVDAVCDAVRAAVEVLPGGRAKFLTVITTSFARKEARQLDLALVCVRDAKEAELSATDSAVATPSTSGPAGGGSSAATANGLGEAGAADKALKHLLLHVDADELYRVALGMYELPLAYMVIANAQRDPGEYMAELQRFGSVPSDALRRHAIDMHLHRYPQALQHLFAAGPEHFAQALSLARERGLLRQLLGLCTPDDARRPQVLDAYGDALDAERKHEDAAVAYMAAGQLAKALQSYRAASQWRMVFILARRLQYSELELQRLAVQVSDELASAGQPAAGAAVLLLYLQDVDNAVVMLTQAKEWREALHTAHQHQRTDLVDTVVAPAAAAAASGLLTDCRESCERIAKYWARLKEVRGKRRDMEAVLAADAAECGGERDVDAQSDANDSLLTSLSMYTENTHLGTQASTSGGGGSGRAASTQGGRRAAPHTQKKGKAKGGKIRQGSPQEEAALVEHLSKLAPTASQLEEAGQLNELLVLLGHFEDARTLQREMGRWQALHQEVALDVSNHPLPGTPGQEPGGGGLQRQQQQPGRQVQPAAAPLPEWKWAVLRDA